MYKRNRPPGFYHTHHITLDGPRTNSCTVHSCINSIYLYVCVCTHHVLPGNSQRAPLKRMDASRVSTGLCMAYLHSVHGQTAAERPIRTTVRSRYRASHLTHNSSPQNAHTDMFPYYFPSRSTWAHFSRGILLSDTIPSDRPSVLVAPSVGKRRGMVTRTVARLHKSCSMSVNIRIEQDHTPLAGDESYKAS